MGLARGEPFVRRNVYQTGWHDAANRSVLSLAAVRRRGFFGAHPAAGLEPLQSVRGDRSEVATIAGPEDLRPQQIASDVADQILPMGMLPHEDRRGPRIFGDGEEQTVDPDCRGFIVIPSEIVPGQPHEARGDWVLVDGGKECFIGDNEERWVVNGVGKKC